MIITNADISTIVSEMHSQNHYLFLLATSPWLKDGGRMKLFKMQDLVF